MEPLDEFSEPLAKLIRFGGRNRFADSDDDRRERGQRHAPGTGGFKVFVAGVVERLVVRFLRDQQDCVIWYLYLYLDPSGEVFVVQAYLDHEYGYEARRDGERMETDLDDPEEQRAAIIWCAPTFEEFAYRFWIENRLWLALNGDDPSGLEPQMRDYLNHYATRHTGMTVAQG